TPVCDIDGDLIWTRQFGTTANGQGNAISADALGNVYIGGCTGGNLNGSNAGGTDVLLVKFADGLPGDFNTDSRVGAADYVTGRKGLTTGAYTQADYNTWRQNFGAAAAAQSAVPEPGSLPIYLITLLALVAARRAKDRRHYADSCNCDDFVPHAIDFASG